MIPVYWRDPATRKLGMIEVETDLPQAARTAVSAHLNGAHIGPVLGMLQAPRPVVAEPVPPGEMEYASWRQA